MKNRIILIGMPGCGKGTLAKALAESRNFTHVCTGDLLRKAKEDGGEIAEALAELGKGTFAADDLVMGMVMEAIMEPVGSIVHGKVKDEPIIFDGVPRNIAQAHHLKNLIGKCPVIFIDVSEDTVIERIKKRGLTSGREDDQDVEVIKKRIQWFKDETYPLVDHYKKTGWLHVVDGEASPEAVLEAVQEIVDYRFYPEYALKENGGIKRTAIEQVKLDGSVKCICCGEDIKPVRSDEDYVTKCKGGCGHDVPAEAFNVMASGATVELAHAGYGSQYDTCKFVIAVCDNCMEDALREGRVVMKGRYM